MKSVVRTRSSYMLRWCFLLAVLLICGSVAVLYTNEMRQWIGVLPPPEIDPTHSGKVRHLRVPVREHVAAAAVDHRNLRAQPLDPSPPLGTTAAAPAPDALSPDFVRETMVLVSRSEGNCERFLPFVARAAFGDTDVLGQLYQSYGAMRQFLSALKHYAVTVPDAKQCWGVLWRQFASRASHMFAGRLARFGQPKNSGVLYVVAGFNEYVSKHVVGGSFRNGWYPQDHVVTVSKLQVTNFTVFFMSFHDEDIYYQTRNRHRERVELKSLLVDFPNFFFLHYSPALVMPDGIGASELGAQDPFYEDRGAHALYGRLFPRMVPIPHAPTDREIIAAVVAQPHLLPKPYRERKHQVAWRGATTGHTRPYARSDRFRVVDQFAAHRSPKYPWADVAFSGVCQGVSPHELPMYGNRMDLATLMQYQVHLDVDGNTNSWDGLRWRLLFGMSVVKANSSNAFVQWYYRHLRNGTHIIHAPVEGVADAAHALLEDEDLGERIATNAKVFGEAHLTYPALDRAVNEAIRNAWSIGYDASTKWCIPPC